MSRVGAEGLEPPTSSL